MLQWNIYLYMIICVSHLLDNKCQLKIREISSRVQYSQKKIIKQDTNHRQTRQFVSAYK